MSLTTSELTWMRATQEASMPGSCQVKHTAGTADGYGGISGGSATVTSYTCRVAVTSGSELVMAGKLTQRLAWMVTLPHDASVDSADTIVYGARTFEVLAVLAGAEWTTATTPGAVRMMGRQSATVIARASPGTRVRSASVAE